MAPKGATLAGLKSVESHVMALGQCRNFLRKLGVRTMVAADTAGAAREVAERGDKDPRGDRLDARCRNLRARYPGAGHRGRDALHHAISGAVARGRWAPRGQGPVVTTFVFQVRNIPAALYKALGGFATNAVNMTKLESYMIEGNFFATQFYADVEGHPDDHGLKLALGRTEVLLREDLNSRRLPGTPFRATANGSR